MGHDIDAVDERRLLLHISLDAACELCDLPAVEVVRHTDSGENPNLTRADIRDDQLADISDPGVSEEKVLYPMPVVDWNRLAHQEVMIASDQVQADADEEQRDENGGDRLRGRHPCGVDSPMS